MILLFEWIIQYAWEHGLHPNYSGLCNNGGLYPTWGEGSYLVADGRETEIFRY